jgi:hypothetical protein
LQEYPVKSPQWPPPSKLFYLTKAVGSSSFAAHCEKNIFITSVLIALRGVGVAFPRRNGLVEFSMVSVERVSDHFPVLYTLRPIHLV